MALTEQVPLAGLVAFDRTIVALKRLVAYERTRGVDRTSDDGLEYSCV
jgi:hypothetical protein